ncbi:MAG TPA: prolipoprotein diacylglyceryl transferase [Thermomicrobiaceae bacterium]|nr:prolipoprotein diacylglyceryl transferase [Thermomicrobiaceae bacterium]
MRITIGMDPNIFQVGTFTLAWHGIAIALAIVVAVAVIYRQFVARGLPVDRFDSLAFWTVVGGILGARLFYVIDHLGYMVQHPLEALAIQQGGLAIYGAVVGGFVAVAILTRVYHFSFGTVIDAIAPGLLLAQAFGRLGCLINGDAWGAPTSGPFALVYTNAKDLIPPQLLGVPTAPYPVYDALMNLAIVVVIWRLSKLRLPAGTEFAAFAAIYAVGRFFITYLRQESVWFWGLQEAQVISLLALVASVAALGWLLLHRSPSSRVTAATVGD